MALRVFSNCSSVSPVNPTMISVNRVASGRIRRMESTIRCIIGHGMLPVHPDQHFVIARLQGQMDLFRQAVISCNDFQYLIAHIARMRRSEIYPEFMYLNAFQIPRSASASPER